MAGRATAKEVDAYLLSRSDSLFYHCETYRRLLVDLLGAEDMTMVARGADGEIIGVLPLLALDSGIGRVYNSLPYHGSNGGIVADDGEAARVLAAAYTELATSSDTLSTTVIPSPFSPPPKVPHNRTDERIAQFTLLDEGPLLERVDSSALRNVRKAERVGYDVVRDPEALEPLARMHDANIRAMGGLPKARRFFELVGERFEPGHDFDVYVARLDGASAAALLVFYWRDMVEYFTPAIESSHRSNQPSALILVRAFEDARERGLRIWNWGGTWTTQESLYRFKRKWAAEEARYAYRTQLNDEGILTMDSSDIAAAAPGFYVVPFSALR